MESRQFQYRELEELMQAERKDFKIKSKYKECSELGIANEAVSRNGTEPGKNVARSEGRDEHGEKKTEGCQKCPGGSLPIACGYELISRIWL
jgi:hypothetical protein